MLVTNWMSTRLVTADPEMSLAEAGRLMEDYNVGHLPVVEDGRLVGIISDRDLKRAWTSDACQAGDPEAVKAAGATKLRQVMTPEPTTVGVFDTIEEAALAMLETKISGLPVLDEDGKVVALITKNDICRALVSLSGVTRGGVQFAMELSDEPGSIREVSDIIRNYGGRMVSIFTSYDRVAEGRRKVFIRMREIDRNRLLQLKDELAHIGVLLYVVDSAGGQKEVLAMGRLSTKA